MKNGSEHALPQSVVTATWLMRLWRWEWFDGVFNGDGNQHLPHILVYIYLQDYYQRPCGVMDIMRVTNVSHARTFRRHINFLKESSS